MSRTVKSDVGAAVLLRRYNLSVTSMMVDIATVLGSEHLRVSCEDEVLAAICAVAS
jgi:hypothetical protein